MWNRRDLKEKAKMNLSGKYWMAFLVTFIMGILASEGGGAGFSGSFGGQLPNPASMGSSDFDSFTDPEIAQFVDSFINSGIAQIIFVIVIVAIIFGIAYRIFVAAPIRVGGMRWFSRSRESQATPSISQMFSLFRKERYMGAVSGMLWRNFWLWIWSVISALPISAAFVFFVIDARIFDFASNGSSSFSIDMTGTASIIGVILLLIGSLLTVALSILVVVKSYSYYLVPWILADNPGIGARRALNLSKQLTRGSRFDMFVLDLSFIGWYLLGLLACCIGMIFVTPYHTATQTELYAALRQMGVDKGLVTMEELGYKLVVPANQQTEYPAPEYTVQTRNDDVNF